MFLGPTRRCPRRPLSTEIMFRRAEHIFATPRHATRRHTRVCVRVCVFTQ